MRITVQQFRQIQSALLSGYNQSGLRWLLRMALDTSLSDISGGGTDSHVIFDIIEWAERNGKVFALIAAAAENNPQNELLRQLQSDASDWLSIAPDAVPPVSSASGDSVFGANIVVGAQDNMSDEHIHLFGDYTAGGDQRGLDGDPTTDMPGPGPKK